MATITKINSKYRVVIRRKGQSISSTFSNRETAELWAVYKEDLIDEMLAFDPPEEELITLKDAFDMKIENLKELGKHHRTILDFDICLKLLDGYKNESLSTFTYEFMKNKMLEWEGLKVVKGGNQHNPGTGNERTISPFTLRRRFATIASVFSYLVTKGLNVENNAQKIATYLTKTIKESKAA